MSAVTRPKPKSSATPKTSTGVRSHAPAARQFDARRSGATEGVTRSRGQAVFTSSAPKVSAAKKATVAKKSTAPKKSSGARSTEAAAPAPRSATANLWSGFAPEKSSSLSAADSSAASQSSGSGSPALALALLGLGLTGLLGAALGTAARRRRVEAGRGSRSSEL